MGSGKVGIEHANINSFFFLCVAKQIVVCIKAQTRFMITIPHRCGSSFIHPHTHTYSHVYILSVVVGVYVHNHTMKFIYKYLSNDMYARRCTQHRNSVYRTIDYIKVG